MRKAFYPLGVRKSNPTPRRLLASLQSCLWAVLALCLGTAWGSRTVDPLDLPKAERPILSDSAEDAGYYFNARWYSPERGSFTGRDPGLQFYSPYECIGNNPLVGVDPDGKREIVLFEASSDKIGGKTFLWGLGRFGLADVKLSVFWGMPKGADGTEHKGYELGFSGKLKGGIVDMNVKTTTGNSFLHADIATLTVGAGARAKSDFTNPVESGANSKAEFDLKGAEIGGLVPLTSSSSVNLDYAGGFGFALKGNAGLSLKGFEIGAGAKDVVGGSLGLKVGDMSSVKLP